MEVRVVTNDEFLDLATLAVKMYNAIDKGINAFQAINTICHYINNNKDFAAIGLYNDKNKLVGFVTGCAFNTETYLYTGIYVDVKNTEWTQKLVEFSFDYVQNTLKYKAWEADASNENIGAILEKYGAHIKQIRYRKEFD